MSAVPVCADCDHCVSSCWGPTHGQKTCVRRSFESKIHGHVTICHTAEYERAWLWRKLGANTCGPEGRFWTPRVPMPPPPAPGVD